MIEPVRPNRLLPGRLLAEVPVHKRRMKSVRAYIPTRAAAQARTAPVAGRKSRSEDARPARKEPCPRTVALSCVTSPELRRIRQDGGRNLPSSRKAILR